MRLFDGWVRKSFLQYKWNGAWLLKNWYIRDTLYVAKRLKAGDLRKSEKIRETLKFDRVIA